MSNTIRKFRGKQYRQGHEPCELELTRKRAKKLADFIESGKFREMEIQTALREAAAKEQEAMGYAEHGCRVFMDGDLWCVLQGDNLHEGIAGFGKTIDEAWEDFEENLLK